MNKSLFVLLSVATAAVFAQVSCDSEKVYEVSQVSVSPSEVVLEISGTAQLTAEVLPVEAAGKPVSWKSGNEAVAVVDASGLVTAVSAGTARIEAACDGVSGSCEVTVMPDPPVIVPETDRLTVGCEGGTLELDCVVENPVDGLELACSCDAGWIDVDSGSGGNSVTFAVSPNPDTESREAVAKLTYGQAECEVTISQDAYVPIGNKLPAEAEVGDYYLSDGSLADGDGELTPQQKDACLGIVFSTDPARLSPLAEEALMSSGADKFHGFVICVVNNSEGCSWGQLDVDVNEDGNEGEPFFDNTATAAMMYDNIYGYEETSWMLEKISAGELDDYYYMAFAQVPAFNSDTSAFVAPAKTTGWFLPSIGQWWDVLENLGGIEELADDRDSDSSIGGLPSPYGNEALEALNARFSKVPKADLFMKGEAYWSSSEYDFEKARRIQFYAGGNLYVGNEDKDMYRNTRLVLVF